MKNDIKYRILDIAMNIITPGNQFTQSQIVEEAVKDVMINKYGENWKEQEELFLDSYEKLRTSFRVENYTDDIPYFYSIYYMQLNIPKVQLTLIQLLRRADWPKLLRILDIGSGVGTTAIAVMDLIVLLDYLCSLHGVRRFFDSIVIDSVEGSEDNIDCFMENISYYEHRLTDYAETAHITVNNPIMTDIRDLNDIEGYDIVIASNVLNEIQYKDRFRLVKKICDSLPESGHIIVIEPASEYAATALNKLKFEVVQSTGMISIGPCGTCNACSDCWIFQTCKVSNGELIGYIDALYSTRYQSKFTSGDDEERMKWAYFILSKDVEVSINHQVDVDEAISIAIVGNRRNNSYRICDGHGKRGFISSDVVELGYYKFGDHISLVDAEIDFDKEYKIKVTEKTIAKRSFQYSTKERFRLSNIDEKSLTYLIKRMWGFSSFREGQYELVKGALEGKDILGILPTGAGKSICYQLPALLGTGISIVVSPLKSLIKDQITNLKRAGFEFVDYIDSSKNVAEKEATLRRFQSGSLKMLYLSPERLQIRDFQLELGRLLKNFTVDYFVIDEAHCASEWGHDFRPSYLKLADVVDSVGFSNIVAVTATASPKVKADILDIFRIQESNVISSHSLDRPELSLEVINLPIKLTKDKILVEAILKEIPETLKHSNITSLNKKGAGIIFTIYADPKGSSTRAFGTTYIKELIRDANIDAELYHSSLNDKDREAIQDRFKNSDFPVLVSTKGFGMGIDKENIRYIVHMCYSNSLEAYYQEAGRAGRDREHAHSLIIARSRTPECVRYHSNIDSYEPRCVNQWICPYTKGIRCDYGMQARFISDAYKEPRIMTTDLQQALTTLVKVGEGKKKFTIGIKNDNAKFYQSSLYYFQKFDIIKNYYVLKYNFGVIQFGIEWPGNVDELNIDSIITQIVDRQQNFKRQKYNMLESVWEYVSNPENTCRRQFLMNYFEDKVSYGKEGCQFCDVEGISEERALSVTRSLRVEKLLTDYQVMMHEDLFDDKKIEWLYEQFEEDDELETAKIRAMRFLEDFTDNQVALYFRCFSTLERDKYDAYARNQANQLVTAVHKKSSFVSVRNILNKLTLIDPSLVDEIILNNESLTSDVATVDDFTRNLFDENQKVMVYKKYISNKMKTINKLVDEGVNDGY